MLKNSENNGTEEIGLVTPTPGLLLHYKANSKSSHHEITSYSNPYLICIYRKISNIRCTKFQNLNDSRLVLHLSLPNLLTPGVK